ncbi:MAG: CocE/NonD family hydrolase [Chloroflexota bacterium]
MAMDRGYAPSLRTSAYLAPRLVLVLVFLALAWAGVASMPNLKQWGQVSGEWTRTSQYVAARDGTRLAVDIFRPVRNGQVVTEPLPVVWTNHRYHRADIRNGRLMTVLDHWPWLKTLLKNGYVVAAADIRGTGASFGVWNGPFHEREREDTYDLTEWFAAQPWCNGRVGMYGLSNMAVNQFAAASTAPPHLKALFPEMAVLDTYSSASLGGIARHELAGTWTQMVRELDVTRPAVPVDADWTGDLLAQALRQHEANLDGARVLANMPFRDSKDAVTGEALLSNLNPAGYMREIEASGIAIYHLTGWYDIGSRDTFVWLGNIDNPQKVVVGPWEHSASGRAGVGYDQAAEHLRWYDYWLKGIENGVMNEPPIRYYTIGAPQGKEWRATTQWPPPNTRATAYYFQSGPSGSVSSVNDGLLTTQSPTQAEARDDYQVDFTASSGPATRWTSERGGPFGYPDMVSNDRKALTYTTPPLASDVEVTGHPIVHLWVTSTAQDGDFFVYLEEVDENGVSIYATEGSLRASHRLSSEPPYEYLGLPYHRSNAEDSRPLTVEPADLTFDLFPISRIFKAGHRIRITVVGADRYNARTPVLKPAPTVSLYRDREHASYVSLPIAGKTCDSP